MNEQITAALITGMCTITAAVIGLIWQHRRFKQQRVLAPGSEPPIFAAARTFGKSSTREEQKKLIQQIEVALSHGSLMLSSQQMEHCASSDWELDRIGLYLFEEYTRQPNMIVRMLHARHEWERLRAAAIPRSVLPLIYAIRSLLVLARQQPLVCAMVRERKEMLVEIRQFLRQHPQLDPDDELDRDVDQLLLLVRVAA